MTGSAKIARCSGRTVTHAAANGRRAASASAAAHRLAKSEIHTEPSLVDLRVAVRVFREQRHVARLDAHQDPHAQREEKSRAGASRPHRFALQDELIDVRKGGKAAETDGRIRLDGPI